jgi:hypothetical protein
MKICTRLQDQCTVKCGLSEVTIEPVHASSNKLLRIKDNTILDERKLGHLSTPRPYMEWTEINDVQFRAELLVAYVKLAD